ncbi:MAG: M3 family oligoendopeptidase [Bacteroidia bacterium]
MMNKQEVTLIEPRKRKYLSQEFVLTNWKSLEPFFEELTNRTIEGDKELEQWVLDRSELEGYLEENLAWRYINYTRNTEDKQAKEAYLYFVQEIQPHIIPFSHKMDVKLVESPYLEKLDPAQFHTYVREVKNQISLYREENIPLLTRLSEESQKYSEITGKMSVEINGKEYTMPQAGALLKEPDRNLRRQVYEKMTERRLADKATLDELMNELLKLRNEVATNAGFSNYRDYKFRELGRFDYDAGDVFTFHDSIREEIVPIVAEMEKTRKEAMKLEKLKPYDLDVDPEGKAALKPFKDADELVAKTVECFNRIDPFLGNCIATMRDMGYLDLESRKGKAPGGYNYPLDEIGVPFIFMNAAGTLRDLKVMVHEGGHAIHSFLTRDYELNFLKHVPSEVAELASMSMELISMEHWDLFFDNEEDLIRAKKDQLENVLDMLPWIAIVDKFQHWLYLNPANTAEERSREWLAILNEFSAQMVDWEGYEELRRNLWQRQLHIYEVPFYYIEYGMAQLGAISVWKNFRENPEKGLRQYLEALKLGYSRPLPEIYEAAGIRFDFSKSYIKALADFVREELAKLGGIRVDE